VGSFVIPAIKPNVEAFCLAVRKFEFEREFQITFGIKFDRVDSIVVRPLRRYADQHTVPNNAAAFVMPLWRAKSSG
jgi:hypothetical protein